MPIGSAPGTALPPRRQAGFAYLLALLLLALVGWGAAAVGEQAWLVAQREKEAELLFRGQEIGQALARYAAVSTGPQARAPQQLQELLEDRRFTPARHHLRRLYRDPFTGQDDWALVRDRQGRIVAVHSRSARPVLRQSGVALRPGASSPAQARDWLFSASSGPGRRFVPLVVAPPEKQE